MSTQEIQKLEAQLKEVKENRAKNIARIVNIDVKQVLAYDNRILFKANSLQEVKQIMNNWKPFKNSQEVKFAAEPTIYLTSLFKITIKNDFHNRKLCFDYENLKGDNCTIEIDFRNFDINIFNGLISKTTRGLYSTETVYVNMPAHYKKFKNIRVEAFRFNGKNVTYYGGNTVLICEEDTRILIETIKNL